MNFYLSFLLFNIAMCVFSTKIIMKSGLDQVVPHSVGLKFFAEINNTSGEDCAAELHPDECCLHSNDDKCNVIQVIGSATDIVPKGSTKILQLVAPLLDQYNRKGFCTFYVDYKSESKPNKFLRDTIKIKFDTTLHKSNAPKDAQPCRHVDEDPMNDCRPVSCDTFYNGKKSYYNKLKKRCEEVPVCFTNANTKIPRSAYNPVSNKCVNKPAISKYDIDFIKALTIGKERKTKDILIIKTKNNNNNPVTPQDLEVDFTPVSGIKGISNTKKLPFSTNTMKKSKLAPEIQKINWFMTSNKNTLMALSAVILVQCCLICTMVYCLTKSCGCGSKKKVTKKFFNYRQDASITTPLICPSNINTETTDYQYLSETSNYIDKKIKCYKACQKERKNSVKLSMSDDILSKCITRRDWHRLPRSETIPEVRHDEEVNYTNEICLEHRKATDVKVNSRQEICDKNPKSVKSIVKKTEKRSNAGSSDCSEKVIQCHSYNHKGGSQCSQSKLFGVYNQRKHTDSIEQGAQASFSNDSIDDFLSERGVLFMGDNASNSFPSISSAAKSTVSSQYSKTSKTNALRNKIPFLSRKAKVPSSDTGPKKSKPNQNLDLELLHISRVSMCSSNDYDLCKDLKRIKDSTSSL